MGRGPKAGMCPGCCSNPEDACVAGADGSVGELASDGARPCGPGRSLLGLGSTQREVGEPLRGCKQRSDWVHPTL